MSIHHLMRQCAVLLAVLSLVTGSFGVHSHIHDGEGLGGAHGHTEHDHGSVDVDLGEVGGDVQGGEPHNDHVHAHGIAFVMPEQGIPAITAMTHVICHWLSEQSLPKTVHFDVDTPPNILAV